MIARTPEELDTLFAKALNAGDLDALTSLYEPDASLMPAPGSVVVGKVAIRSALAGFLAAKPSMTLTARTLTQTGDLALVSAQWRLAMNGPDGNPSTMTGQSVEVLRRQPDGRWLFAIDFPFGVG
ncbi:MAG TPA: SgcJ/EcaC family oxidoreductase [Casimicrobiaceae bacterium]|jgi:uncharacterized protein (TIGR02246 family)|nr:SgcJ/EcaC family oxidoreductase [Casimicrobiaceae bacterium]